MPYFTGTRYRTDDDGKRVYQNLGPVWVRDSAVVGFYDHCILTKGDKIWVMEDFDEIAKALRVPLRKIVPAKKDSGRDGDADGSEREEV